MKNFRQRTDIIWLCPILILIMSLMTAGCGSDYNPVETSSPLMRLLIENQTEQTLTVYYGGLQSKGSSVEPGKHIIIENVGIDRGSYFIVAQNAQGEVVFSETYTFKTKDKYHLQELEERVYKAVIPPLGNGPESSDNVTLNK